MFKDKEGKSKIIKKKRDSNKGLKKIKNKKRSGKRKEKLALCNN